MPDDPARPALRASDADRERVAKVLNHPTTAGRLTVDELSDRTDLAYAAATLAELERLVADLPIDPGDQPEAPMPEEAQVRRGFRGHLTTYGLVVFLLVVIWILTGVGYFWPVWPALGLGVGIAVDFPHTPEEIEEIRSASPGERHAVAARSTERP